MPDISEAQVYANSIKQAASDAPVKIAQPVVDAVQAVVDELLAVKQAQADASQNFADPTYSGQEQIRRANVAMSAAIKSAVAAVNALDAATPTAKANMERYFLPGRSASMTDADVADRKADLTAVVMSLQGSTADRIGAVVTLLTRALKENDALSAYVLCAKLGFIYDAAGLGRDVVNARLAQAVSRGADAGTGPAGAAFLTVLAKGGAGTPAGLVTLARNNLYSVFDGYRRWVEMAIQNGQVLGVPSNLPQQPDWQAAMNALSTAVQGQAARATF